MAGTDVYVKSEPYPDTGITFEALDVSEMKLEDVKCEVSSAEVQEPKSNACIKMCEETPNNKRTSTSSFNVMISKKALGSEQRNIYCRSSARLSRSGYSTNMIIHYTLTLVEDFYLMSQCRNSLYCSKVPFPPTMVMCNQCGRHFIGIGNRMLKLTNHFESNHKLIAEQLILDMIERYSGLLEQMKKSLRRDQVFIANHIN
ncbi:hypothetical protein ONE63_008107 [Megalurothrips usitatus]|uniref:C2H2-type domain-containing protein n=1 Tax=Megalurothrips usitatus TaxID=439358 RepID=A0AAV7XMP3_9NEOP|nr:hypothetical protein ONE63_008107 [Megalurothrips usitatus]